MWLDTLFKKQIQDGSNNIYPQRPTWQFTGTGVGSIVDDPANNRTILTFLSGAQAQLNVANVAHAQSPVSAVAGQTIVCAMTNGAISVVIPVLSAGQFVTVEIDDAAPTGGTLTVTRADAGKLAQPAPNNGTSTTSYAVTSAASNAGLSLTWYNGGSSDGRYLLA